jgi:MFS family permease
MSQAFSALGNAISPVALALLVLGAGSASQLGLVLGAQSAGLVGFVLVGGVLADRLRRTRVMAAADVLRAAATFGFAVFGQVAELPMFMLLAFLLGLGTAMFDPAERALLPALVPDHDLQAANALNSVTNRVALVVGPPLGGLLAVAFDPRVAFAVDGVTFVVSVATLLTLRVSRLDPAAARGSGSSTLLAEAWQGVQAVRAEPWAAAVMAQGAVQVLLVHAPVVVLVPLVLRAHGQLGGYGLVLAAQAVGSVLGAGLAARWTPREPGSVALLGMLAGVPSLLVLLVGLPVWVLAGTVVLTGAGGALFAVLWASALQRRMPDAVLGRVVSLDYVGQLGLEPVGLALTVPAVAELGLSTVVATCTVALLVTTALPFLVRGVRTFGDPVRSAGR